MWYVIQVIGGQENKVLQKIEKLVAKDTYKRCFIPKYEIQKRYAGQWQLRQETLFPGYVFVETKTPDSFAAQLTKVSDMTRLLCSSGEAGDKHFIALSNHEKTLISAFIGEDSHVLKMSEGIIEGDEVVVLKGPLMNFLGLVKKIDRHKRLAYLEIVMFGRVLTIKAGLEIVRKS